MVNESPRSELTCAEVDALRARIRDQANEWRLDYNEMSERKDTRIAELEAALEPARVALTLAARTFETYAQVHRAKGTDEGAEKAAVNMALCIRMREALALFPAKAEGSGE